MAKKIPCPCGRGYLTKGMLKESDDYTLKMINGIFTQMEEFVINNESLEPIEFWQGWRKTKRGIIEKEVSKS